MTNEASKMEKGIRHIRFLGSMLIAVGHRISILIEWINRPDAEAPNRYRPSGALYNLKTFSTKMSPLRGRTP